MRILCCFVILFGLACTATGTVNLSPNLGPGTVGQAYSGSIMANASGCQFSLGPTGGLPPGLMLNQTSGAITGTPTTPGTFSFVVQVVCGSAGTGFGTFSITINSGTTPVRVTPTTAPNGTVGQPYSLTFGATGGTSPYTFQFSGAGPTGTSYNPTTNSLSGTPNTAGTTTFAVTATDSLGAAGSQSYTLVINPAQTNGITINDNCPATVQPGQSVNCTIAPTGGGPTYSITVTGLPSWLTFAQSGNTGTITGTVPPTATGSYTYTVIVTSESVTATSIYTIAISSGAGTGACALFLSTLTRTDTLSEFQTDSWALNPPLGAVLGLGQGPPWANFMPPGTLNVGPAGVTGNFPLTLNCNDNSGQTAVPLTIIELPALGTQSSMTQTTTDPIDTATGELSDHQRLFYLGGPLPLTFEVFYSTLLGASGFSGALGNNWMHNFEIKLNLITDGVQVSLMGGKVIRFGFAAGIWTLQSPEPNGYQLTNSSFGYQLLDPATRWTYSFTNAGALAKISDRNGNALTITQGPNGPADVADGLGRTLHFGYQGSKLVSVTDQSGRLVSFGYTQGALTSLTDALGATTNYTYTSVTALANGLPPMTNLPVSKQMPVGNTPYTQTYDAQGNVSKQTDSLGHSMLLAYNTPGHATTVTDARGNTETDTNLYQVATTGTTDANGNMRSFNYDANLRRSSVKDRLGNVTNATYHQASGYPASVTDPQGHTTTFNYASQTQGNFTWYVLSGIKFADGASISFTYDNSGNVLTETDEVGKVTTYTYNSLGQVATVTNPAGGVTKITYNPDATAASIQDPAGNISSYTYDTAKRVTAVSFADGTSASLTYDADDRILSATDQRGNTTKYAYDANGNLVSATDALNKSASAKYDADDLLGSVTNPAGNTSAFQFDEVGNPASATNGAGEKYTYSYDALNRLTSFTDPSGKGLGYVYDKEGRLNSFTDAASDTTTYTRDSLGRVVQAATPLNENYAFTYDALGRVTSMTNPLTSVTSYSYDARGLLTGIAAPGGINASFAYDDLGEVSSVTDPDGNVWTEKHDSSGRLISQADPLGRAVSYGYDSRSRVKTITNALGTAQVTYDPAGNLTQLKYSDGTTLNYTYDQNNRLTGGGGFSIGYDEAGRIISSNGLTMTRDGAGRISSITYAPGKTVTYTYDARGLLSKVSDWAGGFVNFVYDASHRLVSLVRSNGVTTQYSYDSDSRLTGIVESGISSGLPSLALQPQVVGAQTQLAINIKYQLNDILTRTQNWSNLLKLAPGLQAFPRDAAGNVNGSGYKSDVLGRRIQDPMNTYSWNLAGQLKTVAKSGSNIVHTYNYDDLSMFIGQSHGTSGTMASYLRNYAIRGAPISIERMGTADERYTVFTPKGMPLWCLKASDDSRSFLSYDERGSTYLLFDDAGGITDLYAPSPDGDTVTQQGTSRNPYTDRGASGEWRDESTGLLFQYGGWRDATTREYLGGPFRSTHIPGDPIAKDRAFFFRNYAGFLGKIGQGTSNNPNEEKSASSGKASVGSVLGLMFGITNGQPAAGDPFARAAFNVPAPDNPPPPKPDIWVHTPDQLVPHTYNIGDFLGDELKPGAAYSDPFGLRQGVLVNGDTQSSGQPSSFFGDFRQDIDAVGPSVAPATTSTVSTTNAAPPASASNTPTAYVRPNVPLTPAFQEVLINIDLYGTPNPTPVAVQRLKNLARPGSRRYAHGYAFINDKGVPEYVCDGCAPQK